MFLYILLLIGLETYMFFHFVGVYGFFDTFGTYAMPCFLGFIILQWFGRQGAQHWTEIAKSGKSPGKRLIHQGMIVVSGVLLMIPMISTRVVATFLLLPGTRHLLVWILKDFLEKKIQEFQQKGFSQSGENPAFKFYTFSSGPQGTQWNSQGATWNQGEFNSAERDVTNAPASQEVIDVQPKKIEHHSEPSL